MFLVASCLVHFVGVSLLVCLFSLACLLFYSGQCGEDVEKWSQFENKQRVKGAGNGKGTGTLLSKGRCFTGMTV